MCSVWRCPLPPPTPLETCIHYIGSAAIRTAKEAKEAKDVEEGEGEDENTILATKRDT